jgi:hypothetical protein
MQASFEVKLLRKAARAASWAALVSAAIFPAAGQANAPGASSAGSIQLQPYTAPDQSASAGVPSGWKVTNGAQTAIQMTGPEGEIIFLGYAVIAHNGAFQLGQKGPAGSDLTMPFTAKLTDKLVMILQQNAAISGKPTPQVTFQTATALQLPPVLGQCGRFVINISGGPTPAKAMGAFCSLPADSSGFFKNIMLMGTAPATVAAQAAPTVQAVFASYKIPQAWLEKKLAPFTMPPPAAGAQGGGGAQAIMEATRKAQVVSDVGAKCFDLEVLRETPNRQLPQECGGSAPNN